jgi:ubiquinone/menaquinone biosynthesis C-methylase UbiE
LSPRSILGIGVLSGANLYAISRLSKIDHIAGTDLELYDVEFANQKLRETIDSNVNIFQARANRLPFTSESFEVVLVSMVLFLIGPDEILESLHEIKSDLGPIFPPFFGRVLGFSIWP